MIQIGVLIAGFKMTYEEAFLRILTGKEFSAWGHVLYSTFSNKWNGFTDAVIILLY